MPRRWASDGGDRPGVPDGYTESLPWSRSTSGRGLPTMAPGRRSADHGFPLRVLIAGRYGMKQPKYLTDIIVADHDEPGYWEQRSDQTAAVRTYSRIDEPLHGDDVPSERPFNAYGRQRRGPGIARWRSAPTAGDSRMPSWSLRSASWPGSAGGSRSRRRPVARSWSRGDGRAGERPEATVRRCSVGCDVYRGR